MLVTGAAGFIGSNLVRLLAQDDWFIIGTDSLNSTGSSSELDGSSGLEGSGDLRLKYARLAEWGIPKEEVRYNKLIVNRHIEKSSFIQLDLTDSVNVTALFEVYDIRAVCHLGGLSDVAGSFVDPQRYIDINLAGFVNVLEQSRKQNVEHVVYLGYLGDPGSSVLHAVSRSNECMAEVISRTYGLPTTGLRVGTVYGPWADPDSLPASFNVNAPAEKVGITAEAASGDKEGITAEAVCGEKEGVTAEAVSGEKEGLFTEAVFGKKEVLPVEVPPEADVIYVDDVIEGLARVLKRGPVCERKELGKSPLPPYRVYDLGSKEAKAGVSNNEPLKREYGVVPKTVLSKGLAAYRAWYKEWYTGDKPRIAEERIIVGRYPFPCSMNWKYIWNKHLELNFSLSDNPDRLLKSLVVSDGFDWGLGVIDPEDWKVYVEDMYRVLKLKPGMSVFEVGCGGGAFLYPLYQKGLTVGGFDYASNLIHLAKLAMPGGRFEVLNAKDFAATIVPVDGAPAEGSGAEGGMPGSSTGRPDVVLANSVFQYFDSLKMAEAVLLAMFALADSTVAVLNVPDLRTEMEEKEASRDALPVNVYDEMYDGLKHLYLERNWFVMMGKRAGWKARVYAQQIPDYGKNAFRYNVVFKKVTAC